MKRTLLTGICCCLAVGVFAQDTTVRYDSRADWDRTVVVGRDTDRDWCNYKANELNFSIFGSGTVGRDTLRRPSQSRIERDGQLGLGAAVSYFFHRNVGIEAYGLTESTHNNWVDYVGGNIIARFPLGDSGVAPYVFGGGGRQLDRIYQWYGDVGAGLEWRFTRNAGLFVDGRYVFAEHTRDFGLGRAGVKFGF